MKNVFQKVLIASMLTVLVACPTSPENLQVTKIIGAEGGTLSSTDGAITLEIPAGTFSSATTVSVEPTTRSDAPWGEANGWSLNGLGIQMKAVGIKFKYSGELPIEWSSVAIQDESKAWFGFGNPVMNKSEKTISVTLPAQTPPGNAVDLDSRVQLRDTTEKRIYIYNDWVFKPLKATIKVKKILKMTLEICRPKYFPNSSNLISINNVEKDCLPSVSSIISVRQYVNEVEYGNSTVGAIVTVINPNDNGESFEYIAPPKVPSPNPVKISMIVTISKRIGKKFNSYITIEPECLPKGNLIQSRVSKAASTCVDLWDGTITTTVHRADNSSGFSYDSTITSNVVFEIDTATQRSGFVKYRLKNGTYTYSLLANNTNYPCRTIASGSGSMPTVFVPTQTYYTGANLVLDTSFDPSKYLGGGISVVDTTTTNNCNSEHIDKTETGPTFLLWWGMTGDFQTASTDGSTLQGSSETPDQLGNTVRSTWNLTRRTE